MLDLIEERRSESEEMQNIVDKLAEMINSKDLLPIVSYDQPAEEDDG